MMRRIWALFLGGLGIICVILVLRPVPSAYLSLASTIRAPPSAESGPVVLILTPIKDTNLRRQQRYEKNILSITYPKSLVKIGFLVSDNQRDDSPALVRKTVERLRRDGNFRSVRANHRIFLDALSKDSLKLETEQSRHSRYIQKSRRARMARARNYLLALELSRECDFVLWLDNDLFSYPKDIIQVMIRATATGKKIVAAPCMESERPGKVYDLNSWRRKQIPPTPSAKPLFRGSNPDDVYFAGYEYDALNGQRLTLKDAQNVTDREVLHGGEGETELNLVQLDAVGGCALFVNADVHRMGVTFPFYPVDNLIETEGLSRIGMKMGVESWGFTNFDGVHP